MALFTYLTQKVWGRGHQHAKNICLYSNNHPASFPRVTESIKLYIHLSKEFSLRIMPQVSLSITEFGLKATFNFWKLKDKLCFLISCYIYNLMEWKQHIHLLIPYSYSISVEPTTRERQDLFHSFPPFQGPHSYGVRTFSNWIICVWFLTQFLLAAKSHVTSFWLLTLLTQI